MNFIASRVIDSRHTPLSTLARDEHQAVTESLQQVLPEGAAKRVAVAAFTSSI
jgi:FXSXX-COOH protein